jgi:F420-dependent methylenetetrahydromethanopterin dehydrogenase
MTMVNKAFIMEASERAPDVIALVHPNSLSNGLKKTPKALYTPHVINMIIKEAPTTK